MSLREFFRAHLFKILTGLILFQIGIFALVQSCNNRPVANRDETNTIEGRTIKINPLANDDVKDGTEKLSVANFSQPIHGVVKSKANLLYYIPSKGFAGRDSFAYTVSNGRKESKQSYVIVRVAKNLEPIAANDEISVYRGSTAVIYALDNDNDREGDSIFIKRFTKPLYGQVKVVNNQFVYSAASSSTLTDSFKYTISDGMNDSKEAVVVIHLMDKNNPCYPWLSSDIGNTAIPGSFSSLAGSVIIKASGADIWNTSDGFRYVYQYVNGDCEMIARIDSFEASNEWAKAGIMVRENLRGNSKMANVCLALRNGMCLQHRLEQSNSAEGFDPISGITPPYWMKLNRTGDSCIYNISANGREWRRIGAINLPMNKDYYVGFAVTSHNNSEVGKVVFSHFRLKAKTATPGLIR